MALVKYINIDTTEAGRAGADNCTYVEAFVLAIHNDVTDTVEYCVGVIVSKLTSGNAAYSERWRYKENSVVRSGSNPLMSGTVRSGRYACFIAPINGGSSWSLMPTQVTSYNTSSLHTDFDLTTSALAWDDVGSSYRKSVSRTVFNGLTMELEEYY